MRFLLCLNIDIEVCTPQRPDHKPFVERYFGTLKYEWLARFSPDNLADALAILDEFSHYYNQTRPHQGQACGNQTPDEAFPDLPELSTVPSNVDPDHWLHAKHGYCYRRRVTSNGTIMIDKHVYYIGQDFAKQQVLVHVDAHRQQFYVTCDDQLIKKLDIAGLHHQPMDFQTYLVMMKAEARSIERHRMALWYKVGDAA